MLYTGVWRPQLIFVSVILYIFLHDRPWIQAWINPISNEWDIRSGSDVRQLFLTSLGRVIAGYDVTLQSTCDVTGSVILMKITLRHDTNNEKLLNKITFYSNFSSSSLINRHVRNKIIYVLSCRTMNSLIRVQTCCFIPLFASQIGE